jgi:hypothetical protein
MDKPPNLIYEKNIKNPLKKIPESLTNLQTFIYNTDV